MLCWLRKCIYSLAAVSFIFLLQAQASLAFSTTAVDGAHSSEDVVAIFLQRIKNIADSGKLFDPYAEEVVRSRYCVGAVGEPAIGVIGDGAGYSNSVLGLREIGDVAGVGEGVAEDDN